MAKQKNQPAPQAAQPTIQPESKPSGFSIIHHPYLPYLCLLAAAWVAYGGSMSNDFVYFDDDKAILYNKTLENPSFSKFFSGQNLGMFAPLTWIFYALGQSISGQEAWGYHFLGIALHALNAVLVFGLLNQLTAHRWASFGAALLFAVHPIQAEAVCWAAGLSAVLFSTFYVAAAWAWLGWSQHNNKVKYALALILFLGACLSKSAAVTLPLLLIAFDLYVGKSLFKVSFWLEKLPFFVISIWFGLHTFSTRAQEGHDIALSSATFSAADRFFMVCQTILFYPIKLLIPFGYSVAYPFVKLGGSWDWTYLVAPLVLGLILFAIWKFLRSNPNGLIGIGLYILPLSVMLPFRTVGSFELRSDRYAYISCIGLFFLTCLVLEKLQTPLRNGILLATAIVLGFFAVQQGQVWNNGVALFENCVRKTPESALCQCNLAYNSLITNQYDASVKHYSEALKYDPSTVEAYNGRGQAWLELGKIPEALDDFTKAIQAGIVTPKLFLNRAKCLVRLNRAAESIPDLNKSLELEPKSAEAHYFRAQALDKAGKSAEALSDYGKAIDLNPNYIEALVNRGQLLFKANRYQESIADNTAALKNAAPTIKPMILTNRANAQLMGGDAQKALEDANQAIQINAQYARAYQTRAAIWQKLGQFDKAAADLKMVK